MSDLLPKDERYDFHPAVDDDIEVIISYIMEDSVDAALGVIDRIRERIESLYRGGYSGATSTAGDRPLILHPAI